MRVRPLSFAMQTQKINLPASSDIWAELQAGSGDKARAKGRHRYSGELGCLAQALVRADNSSPPSVMHNSPALPPSVRSSLSLLSLISYKTWKPPCPSEPEGCQATCVGAEAHLDTGNKHACAPRNTAAACKRHLQHHAQQKRLHLAGRHPTPTQPNQNTSARV